MITQPMARNGGDSLKKRHKRRSLLEGVIISYLYGCFAAEFVDHGTNPVYRTHLCYKLYTCWPFLLCKVSLVYHGITDYCVGC